MNGCKIFRVTLLVVLLAIIFKAVFAADAEPFHIPRIAGIAVDGSGSDWGNRGFYVGFLTDPDGRALAASDFDVKFRLGWDARGLLVLATVRDDVPIEHENVSRLWQRDCVELFLAAQVGSSNRFQLVAAPGADPRFKELRSKLYDWRPENQRDPELSAHTASRVIAGGYVIEALLPWQNLGIEPGVGKELAFQLVANDDDGEEANDSLRAVWFPSLGSHIDPKRMYRIKLSDAPGEPILSRVERQIALGRCSVSVRGSDELIGKPVRLRSANRTIAEARLAQKEGRAGVRFDLDAGKYKKGWPQLDVLIGGKIAAKYEALPTLDHILERYIRALGGRAAIEKLQTRACKGTYILDLAWREPKREEFPFEGYAASPGKWLIKFQTFQTAGGSDKTGFDGQACWKQGSDRIERKKRLSFSKLASLLDPQGALHMQDYFPGMTLEAKKRAAGHTVYVVRPTALDPAHYSLYFDAETFLLVQLGYFWQLHDYREQDGVLFPFRIETSKKGGSGTYVFDRVEHNVPIDDSTFARPEAGPVFADAFQGIEDAKVLPMLQMKGLSYEHGEMNIPCRDGRFLYDLILQNGCKRGLEIGTYNGYSTLWFGLAFRKTGGRVVTIEIDPQSGRQAQKSFKQAGLDDVIDARIADAFKEIPHIHGTFDFVFIDADKRDYLKFFKLLKDRVTPGGVIAAHNVVNYARDMRDFLDAVKSDPQFETTIHNTSAEGISVSIKKKQ